LPATKQPAAGRVLVAGVLSAASAVVHWPHMVVACVEDKKDVTPEMPLVEPQSTNPWAVEVVAPGIAAETTPQNGRELEPDLKPAGFPVMFQRSANSPDPLPPVLKSWVRSNICHGWEV